MQFYFLQTSALWYTKYVHRLLLYFFCFNGENTAVVLLIIQENQHSRVIRIYHILTPEVPSFSWQTRNVGKLVSLEYQNPSSHWNPTLTHDIEGLKNKWTAYMFFIEELCTSLQILLNLVNTDLTVLWRFKVRDKL